MTFQNMIHLSNHGYQLYYIFKGKGNPNHQINLWASLIPGYGYASGAI